MMKRIILRVLGLGVAIAAGAGAAPVADLWEERMSAVVAVEFITETELDRRPSLAFGVVVDREGTVILPQGAVQQRATPSQLTDFRVYRPGRPVAQYSTAEYLGQDHFTGWHFVRVAEEGREGLRPISDFAGPASEGEPRLGQAVWGIGLRKKDEDFRPYLLGDRVSVLQAIPLRTAVAMGVVAAPGLPVFDEEGVFLGLGAAGFGETFVMFSAGFGRSGQPIMLVSPEETAAFNLAREVLPHVGRVPKNVFSRPRAWLGAHGLQPLDPEVAGFLNLESQAALMVSEVLKGSPAATAGLQERDIILEIDGDPLPRLKPDRVVLGYLDREIDRRRPGDELTLTVLRDRERVTLPIKLTEVPKLPLEAERRYFDRLGLTIREFVYPDAVVRRASTDELTGVIAHFVKPSAPVAEAGVGTDDWIKQIDGVEIASFEDAAQRLEAIEADLQRNEFVMLTSRNGETAVQRVRLR